MDEFISRRAAVSDALADAVAVIPAAVTRLRNGDSDWRFRQNSDFYYLTCLNEPEAVLVIAPARSSERVTLFLRPRDRAAEMWTGHRLGVERAAETLGVDAAYPIEEFDQRLPGLLAKSSRLMYALGTDEAFDRRVMLALARARRQTAAADGPTPHTIVDPGRIIHELRVRKSEAEIATLRRAGAITRLGHIAGMRATRPGVAEYEIQAAIEYAYRVAGSQEPAYTSIVAGGDNATILHYTDNRDRLADGALLLVDSAAELDNYATDVTRTWPVSGRFSAEQRAVYEIVLAAQEAAVDAVRPGASFGAYHERAVAVIVEGLIDLGLLAGPADRAIEEKTYRDFYMHGTGHWLGLDVHDAGAYRRDDGTYRDLEPGMVLTVEPGIYIARDTECDARFHGIGVRIEDDVLCTPDGPDVLTPDIPKTIGEIESIVGTAALAGSR